MIIADYLAKQYQNPPCWLLVSDVYANELELEVKEFKTITDSIREIAEMFRIALYKGEHGFRQISEPVDFCVVLMGKSLHKNPTHAGIYYDGGILHATLQNGVLYEPMHNITDAFKRVEYWQHGNN